MLVQFIKIWKSKFQEMLRKPSEPLETDTNENILIIGIVWC